MPDSLLPLPPEGKPNASARPRPRMRRSRSLCDSVHPSELMLTGVSNAPGLLVYIYIPYTLTLACPSRIQTEAVPT